MTRSGLLSAALLFSICIQPAPATAQPVLSVQSDIAAPGETVSVTLTGAPGRSFALLGSSVGGGLSHAGVALRVGSDFAILALGVIGSSGQVAVGLTPPFTFSAIDRYYIQAVTSPTPSFASIDASNGRVIRNADLVGNLQGGPPGPIGPPGPTGPAGPPGAALSLVNAYGTVVGVVTDVSVDFPEYRYVHVLLNTLVGGLPAVLRAGSQTFLGLRNDAVYYPTADCTGTGYIGIANPPNILPPAAVVGGPGAQVLHVADPQAAPTSITGLAYRPSGAAGCQSTGGSFQYSGMLPVASTLALSTLGPAPFRVVRTP